METVIVYGSCYGTAKIYAETLAEQMKCKVLPYDKVKETDGYETIIYVGGLYAGGVRGMAKTAKNIRKAALRQIPKPLADRTEFYHLRGGIDYEKLSFKHRMMMKMLYEQVKKQAVGEQDEDTRAMIETYGQKVSFVDLACLDNIVKKLEGYPA